MWLLLYILEASHCITKQCITKHLLQYKNVGLCDYARGNQESDYIRKKYITTYVFFVAQKHMGDLNIKILQEKTKIKAKNSNTICIF